MKRICSQIVLAATVIACGKAPLVPPIGRPGVTMPAAAPYRRRTCPTISNCSGAASFPGRCWLAQRVATALQRLL